MPADPGFSFQYAAVDDLRPTEPPVPPYTF